jgi:hypothetical protein
MQCSVGQFASIKQQQIHDITDGVMVLNTESSNLALDPARMFTSITSMEQRLRARGS